MIKYITFLFLSLSLFAEDDLSLLLNNYESQSELHKKTKDESAGHLIIYSRKDLDKMQAHTLDNVLKSLRYFTLQENTKGNIGLQRAGANCANAGCIRLYINDQEMSSAISSSALMIFGEYDLGHIDHIEVYLGGNALKFGNEYGFVTIKMYTKEASREKGGFVNASYGTNDSYSLEAFHAGVTDENLEYLAYAKKKEKKLGSLVNSNTSIPRYTESTNFYASLKKKDNYTIELSSYKNETDALAGVGTQKTAEVSYIPSEYNYVAFTKYFDKFKFFTSYALEEHGVEIVDPNGIKYFDGSVNTNLNARFENSVAKIGLEHNSEYGNNDFFYGVNYQRKEIDFKSGTHIGIDSIEIYSAFLEYNYHFNEKNMFVFTGKWEHYKHNGYERSEDLYQRRVGFISLLTDELTFKGFYSHNFMYPAIQELITFPRPVEGNPELKAMEIQNYSAELIYTTDVHELSVMYMQMNIYDPVKINKSPRYFNKDLQAIFNDYAVDYTYKFDSENKLSLEYYFTLHNRPSDLSPASGGYIKFFNTFGSFDMYNELIYREHYYSREHQMYVDDGYDWTTAITYHVNKQFTLALKGENLLDKAIASPIKGLYPVETIDRRITIYASWFY